jgi:beta-lactam-binding protein with PASTA domain
MADKKTKTGFLGNWIVRNLLAALSIAVVLLVGAMIFLNVATKHNQELIVPDLSNMSVADADSIAVSEGMRIEVVDSVFVKRMKKGAVYRQNPIAGSKVKQGRRISLTINAVNAKKVTMPNVVGLSMRQAMAEIQSRGLVLGKLIYKEDLATNNVLRQLMNDKDIEPGTQVESEAVVNLVLGLDASDSRTYVPDVLGMRNISAVDAVHSSSLNIKRLRFDSTVKDYDDSLAAVVYKQTPEPSDSVSVMKGGEITLFMTIDENKVPQRLEKQYSAK